VLQKFQSPLHRRRLGLAASGMVVSNVDAFLSVFGLGRTPQCDLRVAVSLKPVAFRLSGAKWRQGCGNS
jgi:hypothetical protein